MMNIKDSNSRDEGERVLVTQVSKFCIYVQPESCAQCSVCAAGRGCRQSGIFRLFSAKEKTFPIEMQEKHNYKKGDVLMLTCKPNALLLATCYIYLLPLLALLLCAFVGEWLKMSAGMVPFFSFGGMACAYYAIRRLRGGTFWANMMQPSIRPVAKQQ